MTQNNSSILTIEQQEKISFTGVEAVDSFSDTLILLTVCGKRVQLTGSKFKVLSFSKGTGSFLASGQVTGVKFGVVKKGFKGLFK